jgi:hypothetical protein
VNDQNISWGWKLATDPDDAVNFINGSGVYKQPVTDVKISLVNTTSHPEFYIFYQRDTNSPPPESWGWKLAKDAEDVGNFLNGMGPYKQPVIDARICGFSKGSKTEFHIFYQYGKGVIPSAWSWKLAKNSKDAKEFLNGDGAYRLPVKRAEIVATGTGKSIRYYIFYQKGSPGQPPGTWETICETTPDAVMTRLNREGDYPSPIADAKIVTSYLSGRNRRFLVFCPPVFLIITRPLFVPSLRPYISWKNAQGFEVCLVTAEWINSHVPGGNIRLKIRNCIRHYVTVAGLKFALLIGDSVDVTTGSMDEEPTLAEPWNLPAGYYQFFDGHQYTTLYYSDQTDRVEYSPPDDNYWSGEYLVAVGVMPVRTPAELANVLFKTMNVTRTRQASFVWSEDVYPRNGNQNVSEIQALAGSGISISSTVFGSSAPPSQIYTALFEQQGMILELGHGFILDSGHGSLGGFKIGNTFIYNTDGRRFQYINPLFIAMSCYNPAYNFGECLDEAYLKTQNGPAVITSIFPQGGITHPGHVLSSLEAGFWQDLFAGRSIGQAYYDHCEGAVTNPLALFGDPSLVIFGSL